MASDNEIKVYSRIDFDVWLPILGSIGHQAFCPPNIYVPETCQVLILSQIDNYFSGCGWLRHFFVFYFWCSLSLSLSLLFFCLLSPQHLFGSLIRFRATRMSILILTVVSVCFVIRVSDFRVGSTGRTDSKITATDFLVEFSFHRSCLTVQSWVAICPCLL